MMVWDWGMPFANVLALIALILACHLLWRNSSANRALILFSVGGCVAWSLFWLLTAGAESLSVDVLSPIQEGTTSRNMKHVYGQEPALHLGWTFRWLLGQYSVLDGGSFPSLRMTVAFNNWLGGINAVLLLSIITRIVGSWLVGATLTWVYVGTNVFMQASHSTGGGHLLSLCFLIGVVLVSAMNMADDSLPSGLLFGGRLAMNLIFAGVVGLLIIAVTTRLEFLSALAFCGGWSVVRSVTSGQQRASVGSKIVGHLLAIFRRAIPYIENKWALVAVFALVVDLCNLSLPLTSNLGGGTGPFSIYPVGYWVRTFLVVSPTILYMPVVLIQGISPAVILLFLFGMWHSVFRLNRFVLLPVVICFLFRGYYVASHDGYLHEMTRYTTFILSPVFVLAAFGLREVSDFARKYSWFRGWKVIAIVFLGMLTDNLSLESLRWRQHIFDEHVESGRESPERSIAGYGTQQAEVQFLVRLVEEHPDCVIASKVLYADSHLPVEGSNHLVLIGKKLREPEEHRLDGELIGAIDTAVAGRSDCILIYEGLDYSWSQVRSVPVTPLSEDLKVVKSAMIYAPPYYSHLPPISPVLLRAYEFPLR